MNRIKTPLHFECPLMREGVIELSINVGCPYRCRVCPAADPQSPVPGRGALPGVQRQAQHPLSHPGLQHLRAPPPQQTQPDQDR